MQFPALDGFWNKEHIAAEQADVVKPKWRKPRHILHLNRKALGL
jgi:hypothetical protein